MSGLRPIRQRNSGVSLLEMLIALAIMSLIAVMATSSMDTISRFILRTRGADDLVLRALNRDELRRWIERAIEDRSGSLPRYAVTGDRSYLRIGAILDDGYFWPGESTEVEIAVRQEGPEEQVFALARGIADLDRSEITRDLELSSFGGRLSVDFFGRKPEEDQARWHTSWKGDEGMPDLLRISISDAERNYPPLYISPGRTFRQREMSLSSLLPPALPSRP